MRNNCVKFLNYDILAIAETHLKVKNNICVENYTWFGHNRKSNHRNARSGSGGVGFLVNNDFLKSFNVSIVENTYDDILWVSCEEKTSKFKFFACVAYLPPVNSTRQVDAEVFMTICCPEFTLYKMKDH